MVLLKMILGTRMTQILWIYTDLSICDYLFNQRYLCAIEGEI